LKSAFETHLRETEQQKMRLEKVFRELGYEPEAEVCEAMEGLIAEGNELIGMKGDPEVKDAALIAARSASSTMRSPVTAASVRSPTGLVHTSAMNLPPADTRRRRKMPISC